MCTWFCETFCCFLIRFQDRLRCQNEHASTDDRLQTGHYVFAPPVPHHRYQGNTSSPPRAIPLAPIYPGGPPPSAKCKKPSPPRTVPRSVPLPVRYPPSQTPTGKHFRHNKPLPNRMKPLPPLRTSVDGRGRGLREGVRTSETLGTKKPPLSSSYATFRTPAPADISTVSSGQQSMSPASVRSAGRFPAVNEEMDKPYHVQVS